MKHIFLLLLFTLSLFASKILNYNIYDRSDRVDIMLTFDIPYEGVISEQTTNHKIIVKLSDTTIEEAKIKKINSDFLTKLTILPMNHATQIIAQVPDEVKLVASQTSDKYGLRLRFKKRETVLDKKVSATEDTLKNLHTKKDFEVSPNYIIAMVTLILLVIIMFYLKRRLPNAKNGKKSSFLSLKVGSFSKDLKDDVNIKFQKSIDANNKIVMIEYNNLSYLVIIGNTNIIIDKFEDGNPVQNMGQFNQVLEKEKDKIEDLLKRDTQTENYEEPSITHQHSEDYAYDIYKRNASEF